MSYGLIIPMMIFGIPLLGIWTSHRQKMMKLQVEAAAEKAAQYAASNSELEQRLRVLERIVTDKGYDVAAQIEALRDTTKVEALTDGRESAGERLQ